MLDWLFSSERVNSIPSRAALWSRKCWLTTQGHATNSESVIWLVECYFPCPSVRCHILVDADLYVSCV